LCTTHQQHYFDFNGNPSKFAQLELLRYPLKKIIFILLTFINFVSVAQQWHHQNPLPSAEDYNAILFITPDTGFIAGTGGIILKTTNSGNSWGNEGGKTHNIIYSICFPAPAVGYAAGDSGTILKTTNGGSDWTVLQTSITNNLRGIFFTGNITGFVAGTSGAIFRTTNGGVTWTPCNTGISQTINSVFFTGASIGFAVSDNGKILKTTDAGITWNTIVSTGNSLTSIHFPVPSTGFAVGIGGHIAKTTDAGATWTYPSSGTNKTLRSVFFSNANTGYIAGDQGAFLKTTNGGSTWSQQAGAGQADLLSISFPDASSGYVAGVNGKIAKFNNASSSWLALAPSGWKNELMGSVCFTSVNTGYAAGDSGLILKTINGGNTWTSLNSGTLLRLSGIHFPSANIGYAVGKNGKILKTLNAGNTWANQVSNCTQWLKAVHFSDNDHGCAVGGGGAILMTSDGGITWTPIVCLTVENEDVFFTSNTTGYIAVGNGFVIRTTDGGSNWSLIYQGGTEPLYSIHFPTVNTGYAVGLNGEIIKTTNGDNTWTRLPDLYPGTGCQLMNVHFLSADTGFVTGTTGILARTFDGGLSWSTLNSGTDQTLSGMDFFSLNQGWLAGSNGAILHGPYLDRPGLPSGPTTFCINPPNTLYTTTAVQGATSYIWSVTPPVAANLSGNTTSVVVNWNNNYTGFAKVSVQALSSNGVGSSFSDTLLVSIITSPDPPGPITGSDTVCPGSSGIVYSVPVMAGATGYVWTVPSGTMITSGQNTHSITVTFSSSPGNGLVTVYATNACGNSITALFPVWMPPSTGNAGPITGPSSICQGTSGIAYSVLPVSNATGYSWTVPTGVSIISGQNTSSIIVDYSATAISGNISVHATGICGNSNTSSLPVTVNGLPGTTGNITGLPVVCGGAVNLTYSVNPVVNASGSTWTVPAGWVIVNGQNTNTLTVSVPLNANSGNIAVYATGFCGNSNTSALNVTVNPLPPDPGAITGPDSICSGSSNLMYTVNALPNVTGYIWTLPVGWTILSGQNTQQVVVTTGLTGTSGNIEVYTVNSCGNSASSVLPVQVEPLPASAGMITGPALVCPGTTGIVYSIQPVLNATGYLWSVPAGDTITSGQNSTSVTVTSGITPGTGSVTVHGINNCGNGQSASLLVTIAALPVADAGTDQSILYGTSTTLSGSAAGGSGNYQWHWEPASGLLNPNLQNPVTIPLTTTTLFTLTVIDQVSQCLDTDTTLVTVTGEALMSGAYAAPNPVCTGGFTQLFGSATGGSGIYTFQWSSYPPGFSSNDQYPVAYPSVNTIYIVEVNDGYNYSADSIEVIVHEYPGMASEPSGPDTVDLNYITSSEFTTTGALQADYYQWECLPSGAGSIDGSGTTATVYWNSAFSGEASVHVRGVNECGPGMWSDPKEVFLENSGITGLEGASALQVMLFPNPSEGKFRIITTVMKSGLRISIISPIGEGIMNKELKDRNSLIDFQAVPGIYFVIIQSQEQKIIKKLIIR
jgi:photosystem II stability/assembly factor-like uncharacterized protein